MAVGERVVGELLRWWNGRWRTRWQMVVGKLPRLRVVVGELTRSLTGRWRTDTANWSLGNWHGREWLSRNWSLATWHVGELVVGEMTRWRIVLGEENVANRHVGELTRRRMVVSELTRWWNGRWWTNTLANGRCRTDTSVRQPLVRLRPFANASLRQRPGSLTCQFANDQFTRGTKTLANGCWRTDTLANARWRTGRWRTDTLANWSLAKWSLAKWHVDEWSFGNWSLANWLGAELVLGEMTRWRMVVGELTRCETGRWRTNSLAN